MSSLLSPEQLPAAEVPYKFVRDKNAQGEDAFAYGGIDLEHWKIAALAGLGQILTDSKYKLLVDDAGFIFFDRDVYYLSGDSSTCKVRGDDEQAREGTRSLVARITGKSVEID